MAEQLTSFAFDHCDLVSNPGASHEIDNRFFRPCVRLSVLNYKSKGCWKMCSHNTFLAGVLCLLLPND